MATQWKEFYIQFDYHAELLATVKQNEILNNTCNMISSALDNNVKSCNFAAFCIDGLVAAVNYENLLKGKFSNSFYFFKYLIFSLANLIMFLSFFFFN